MYCKECGKKYEDESAIVCLECGVKKGNGNKRCDNCGEIKKRENQDICLNCGKDFKLKSNGNNEEKTRFMVLLLWFFLGMFGAHQFYVGNTNKGILYAVLTIAGFFTCGITAFVTVIILIFDLVGILSGTFEDENGNEITKWI